MKVKFYSLVSILIGIISQVECYSGGIKLKDVDTLIFKANHFTSNRKGGHPDPQLKCLGGSLKCKYLPKLVKCHNQGIKGSGEGYKNINWRCEADLHDGYSFDKIRVNCEPFEHSNDMVVKGSCGLEYALDYDDDYRNSDDKKGHIKQHRDIGNWITYVIARIPKKSAELFFKNIFTFVLFSAIVYLFFFGWPTLPRRRQLSTSWNSDDPDILSANTSRFNRREREESIWATIIKVILEFAFEKLLKAFIR